MRLVHALGAAVAATTLVASVAQATLTLSVVPIVVRFDDPARSNGYPANARSFNLMVNQSGGEKWDVATLQTTLAQVNSGGVNLSGTFYNPASHSDIQFPASPAYDTAFTTPRFAETQNIGHIDLLGKSDYPANSGAGTPITGATAPNNALNLAWGDKLGNDAGTVITQPGSYKIATLTVVGNTGGFLNGYLAGNANINTAQFFTNVRLPIAGDTNSDGAVDGTDFNVWFANLGNHDNPGDPNDHTLFAGDMNQDGQVDGTDFNIWFGNLGNHLEPAPGAALGSVVPEPMSLSLLAMGGLGFLSRRRRSM